MYSMAQPTAEMCAYLAEHMRKDDAAELAALGHKCTGDTIMGFVAQSAQATAFIHSGVVVGIGGVVDRGDAIGNVWLLTGHACEATKLTFWKTSKAMLRQFSSGFNRLYVHVDSRYERAVAWLSRLGFEMEKSVESASGELFFVAEWRR